MVKVHSLIYCLAPCKNILIEIIYYSVYYLSSNKNLNNYCSKLRFYIDCHSTCLLTTMHLVTESPYRQVTRLQCHRAFLAPRHHAPGIPHQLSSIQTPTWNTHAPVTPYTHMALHGTMPPCRLPPPCRRATELSPCRRATHCPSLKHIWYAIVRNCDASRPLRNTTL